MSAITRNEPAASVAGADRDGAERAGTQQGEE